MDFGGTTTEENILNMHEIMYTNKCAMELYGVDILYTDSPIRVTSIVLKDTQTLVNIDYEHAKKIYEQWYACHSDWEDTLNWKYYANRSNIQT